MLSRRTDVFVRNKTTKIPEIVALGFCQRLDEVVNRRVEKLEQVAKHYMLAPRD